MIQPEEAVKYAAWLIENGCSINAQNREGNTALHLLVACATEHFDKELMHCLVCKGADVDTVRDIDNCTVIDAASKSSNLLLSSYLAELIESKSRLIKQRASYVKAVDPLRGYSYLSIYLSDCILRNHRLVHPSTDDDDGL
jgi:ankyrin repeat protein